MEANENTRDSRYDSSSHCNISQLSPLERRMDNLSMATTASVWSIACKTKCWDSASRQWGGPLTWWLRSELFNVKRHGYGRFWIGLVPRASIYWIMCSMMRCEHNTVCALPTYEWPRPGERFIRSRCIAVGTSSLGTKLRPRSDRVKRGTSAWGVAESALLPWEQPFSCPCPPGVQAQVFCDAGPVEKRYSGIL